MMKKIVSAAAYLMVMTISIQTVSAQCATWLESPKKTEAEGFHSIYRERLKTKDYPAAYENWQKVYEIAPAADGKRDYHFVDGAQINLELFKVEKDATKKEAYKKAALELWDAVQKCYEAGTFTLSSCKGKGDDCYTKKQGFLYGRQAYDMYYFFNTPYGQTLSAIEKAIEKSGNDVEYTIFDPASTIVVYQFKNGKLSADEARAWYQKLIGIAEANIEKKNDYSATYEGEKNRVLSKFNEIENEIFDCEYFKAKYRPEYDANPNDPKTIKKLMVALKKQGCDDSDPLIAEMNTKWKKYASAENARLKAEYEANNPGLMAKKLASSGDYKGAIAKYEEAINSESDPEKKAFLHLAKASIEYGKLKSYGAARNSARKAASLKSNWGKPYILIGDMYGSSARSCGDNWNQRLAIIAAMEKYSYAKSIDPSVADDANKRLGKYRAALPEQQEGFMRGVKKGSKAKVGCWIGETVTVKFK